MSASRDGDDEKLPQLAARQAAHLDGGAVTVNAQGARRYTSDTGEF